MQDLEEIIRCYPSSWDESNPTSKQFFNLVQYIIDMMDHDLWEKEAWCKIFEWNGKMGRFNWK
jgi:hypothetical protein